MRPDEAEFRHLKKMPADCAPVLTGTLYWFSNETAFLWMDVRNLRLGKTWFVAAEETVL